LGCPHRTCGTVVPKTSGICVRHALHAMASKRVPGAAPSRIKGSDVRRGQVSGECQ
jgi:hypothetical protein